MPFVFVFECQSAAEYAAVQLFGQYAQYARPAQFSAPILARRDVVLGPRIVQVRFDEIDDAYPVRGAERGAVGRRRHERRVTLPGAVIPARELCRGSRPIVGNDSSCAIRTPPFMSGNRLCCVCKCTVVVESVIRNNQSIEPILSAHMCHMKSDSMRSGGWKSFHNNQCDTYGFMPHRIERYA